MAKKNVFGQSLWLKKKIFQTVGSITRARFLATNSLHISGSEVLLDLPDKGVLFVSNHQTIFTDVVAMYHTIFATQTGQLNSIEKNNYLGNPKLNLYYVAARETMEKGMLPRILALAGAVSVDRTWRQGDQMIKREVNPNDTKSIGIAVNDGWLITFPQGTTREGAPVRKGTAHIIKQYRPIVVPVRVDGFREAFNKTGLKLKQKGTDLYVKYGKPLDIDYENDTIEQLVVKIAEAIGVPAS